MSVSFVVEVCVLVKQASQERKGGKNRLQNIHWLCLLVHECVSLSVCVFMHMCRCVLVKRAS